MSEKSDTAKRNFRIIDHPTWEDLAFAIRNAGLEFGMGYYGGVENDFKGKKIDGYVIAYWVPGGSEGVWVHVHEMKIMPGPKQFEMSNIAIFLKFLTEHEVKDAEDATNFILDCCQDINMW